MTDAEALDRLLWMIARHDPDHYIEVRSLGRPILQSWTPADQPREVAQVIRSQRRTHDVYVGCAPRSARRGGRDAVPHSWVLWADCDSRASVAALRRFPIEPGMVIFSGSDLNAHAWWALSEPVSCDTAEDLNRRIAYALGSDIKVSDAPRIFRPPGTLNHKHVPPRRVRAVQARGGLFSPQPFADLPSVPFEGSSARSKALRGPRRGNGLDSLLGLSAADYVGRLLGRDLRANDKTPCPFHGDGPEDGGSLHLYPGDRGWHCFGCDKGGTVYDFGHHLWGMSTRGAEFVELKERLERELGVGA